MFGKEFPRISVCEMMALYLAINYVVCSLCGDYIYGIYSYIRSKLCIVNCKVSAYKYHAHSLAIKSREL